MSGIFVPAGASEKLCDKSNSPLNLFFRLKEKFNCMKHQGSPKFETISLKLYNVITSILTEKKCLQLWVRKIYNFTLKMFVNLNLCEKIFFLLRI